MLRFRSHTDDLSGNHSHVSQNANCCHCIFPLKYDSCSEHMWEYHLFHSFVHLTKQLLASGYSVFKWVWEPSVGNKLNIPGKYRRPLMGRTSWSKARKEQYKGSRLGGSRDNPFWGWWSGVFATCIQACLARRLKHLYYLLFHDPPVSRCRDRSRYFLRGAGVSLRETCDVNVLEFAVWSGASSRGYTGKL